MRINHMYRAKLLIQWPDGKCGLQIRLFVNQTLTRKHDPKQGVKDYQKLGGMKEATASISLWY